MEKLEDCQVKSYIDKVRTFEGNLLYECVKLNMIGLRYVICTSQKYFNWKRNFPNRCNPILYKLCFCLSPVFKFWLDFCESIVYIVVSWEVTRMGQDEAVQCNLKKWAKNRRFKRGFRFILQLAGYFFKLNLNHWSKMFFTTQMNTKKSPQTNMPLFPQFSVSSYTLTVLWHSGIFLNVQAFFTVCLSSSFQLCLPTASAGLLFKFSSPASSTYTCLSIEAFWEM